MNPFILMMFANAITYSGAVVLILSTMIPASTKRLLLAYVALVVVMILLTPVIAHTWIVPPLLLTLCLWRGAGGVRTVLAHSLTAVFIIWVIDTAIACVVMFFATEWHGGIGFNYFMCGVNLLAALVFQRFPALARAFRKRPNTSLIVLQILVIVYFSMVLPLYFTELTDETKRQFALMLMPALLSFLGIWLLTRRATHLEDEMAEQERREHIRQEYGNIINEQFKAAQIQRHYSLRMFRSLSSFVQAGDMEGLTAYFQKHVAPIGDELRGEGRERLENINNALLRNLIDSSLSEAHATLPHVTVEFTVTGVVTVPGYMEMDLFKIMSIYIGNALTQLRELPEGTFIIGAKGNTESISLVVSNTVGDTFSIRSLEQIPAKWDVHGHGLYYVRELSLTYPDLRTSAHLLGEEGQRLLSQNIEIAVRKEEWI